MMSTTNYSLSSELGKKSAYETSYNPDKLFPIPRKINREALGIHSDSPPFYGYDVWNHYEVSWLNEKGKPMVAVASIIYPCNTLNIIESKSMKLYFNSYNNTKIKDTATLQAQMVRDLEARLSGGTPIVQLTLLQDFKPETLEAKLQGVSIDGLDVVCAQYHNDPSLLKTENDIVEEVLYTDLLKSNCLVTNQPDWCSVQIAYRGKKINREGLLKYIVSFRDDNEFHEQCIEKIFMHLMQYCTPEKLTVYGRSTRRGGLDINSYRSTDPVDPLAILNVRLCRQ